MYISVTEEEGIQIFRITGEIDFYNSRKVGAVLKEAVAHAKRKILLDLEGVPYVDSSALIVLMRGINDLSRIGGSMKLIGVQESLLRVLELTGLAPYVDIYYTRRKALEAFN